MGGSSSKHNAAAEPMPSPSPATSSIVERSRSYRSRVFQSSCLRSHSDDQQVTDHRTKENGGNIMYSKKTKSKSGEAESRCSRKFNVERPDTDLDEWGQSSLPKIMSTGGNTPCRVLSSRSINSTSNFPSRCSCLPGNMSFRLHRANSLGSSGAFCTSSTRFKVSNDDDEVHGRSSTSDVSVSGDERPQSCDIFAACFSNRSPRTRHQSFSNNDLQFGSPSPSFSNNWQHDQHIASAQDNGVQASGNASSPRNHIYREHFDTGLSNRRIAAREPIDRNVRFSRTLSVGRLRERSSFLDSAFSPFQRDRELGHASQTCRRPASSARSEPEGSIRVSPASSGHPQFFVSGSPSRNRDCETGISRARRARYLDPLEHQPNFSERGRRIRSQARALQRLGSRFQHLSSHERSCILSGQHRTGRCTCGLGTRGNNSNNETTARASISRIVMLAEALFEVLDEIHQQSVVLSSQTSVSPIGSVPAPNEIVESLPVKLYSRVQEHGNEENAQCYICLLEYEEGDTVRVLPCHHEFHKICIDKWLKEIHRVCPLCRGDICEPPSVSEH